MSFAHHADYPKVILTASSQKVGHTYQQKRGEATVEQIDARDAARLIPPKRARYVGAHPPKGYTGDSPETVWHTTPERGSRERYFSSLSLGFCAEALLLDSQPSIVSRNRCSVARVPAFGV